MLLQREVLLGAAQRGLSSQQSTISGHSIASFRLAFTPCAQQHTVSEKCSHFHYFWSRLCLWPLFYFDVITIGEFALYLEVGGLCVCLISSFITLWDEKMVHINFYDSKLIGFIFVSYLWSFFFLKKINVLPKLKVMAYFLFIMKEIFCDLGFLLLDDFYFSCLFYLSCQRLRYMHLKVSHKYCVSSIFLVFPKYFITVT